MSMYSQPFFEHKKNVKLKSGQTLNSKIIYKRKIEINFHSDNKLCHLAILHFCIHYLFREIILLRYKTSVFSYFFPHFFDPILFYLSKGY